MVNISNISDILDEFIVIFSSCFSDSAVEIPINMPSNPALILNPLLLYMYISILVFSMFYLV
jgi:hypothetical protein